jgi:fermentation-respiration switch protein FrsA (DUF1100 family)
VYESERARGTPAARIVCFGESLGSAVTIQLALERPCAGVVVVSPFTTLAEVARRHYGPLGGLAGDRFDALGAVRRLTVPILVAHGDRDEIVPFDLGERLFAAAPEPKQFLRVAGAHHNDVFDALPPRRSAFARDASRCSRLRRLTAPPCATRVEAGSRSAGREDAHQHLRAERQLHLRLDDRAFRGDRSR